MSLFSLIAAFLLEQVHPLASRKYLFIWMNRYADFFQHHFNAGEHKHGKIAWGVAMSLPLLSVSLVYWLLMSMHPLFAWIGCVLVLYLTMGFRRFSHYFTDIQKALRKRDLDGARTLLSEWTGTSCQELSAQEVARVTIEQALLASHRNVFGVVIWFVIFMLLGLGPVGAILYRLALFLNARWGARSSEELGDFGKFAHQACRVMEWMPLRLTAMTFAIVGDFEDTVYCWRTQAKSWPDPEAGIVLASGAGALGVRLGLTIVQDSSPVFRPEIGMDEEADVDFMQSAIGLVWRALVFWLVLLLLLSLASLVG
ncbi:MAG: CobD/CbiB family protein [Gallionellaceae bacterium]|jgi:cobalamin biosynthesis protein CobD/CbiB